MYINLQINLINKVIEIKNPSFDGLKFIFFQILICIID